ncbi:MAG: hemolysin family protein [bacterium]|nr:hemolysin family protein [bacterium]
MAYEIFIVLILTLLNGLFSMSEIALVTVRKTRVSALIKQGNKRAKVIQFLKENPEDLFATIQVGISVITIAASAFAGASIAADLALSLEKSGIAFIAAHAHTISFAIVVALVSYVNITIGELIPKSTGLRYAEPIALAAAYPVWWLSRISGWLITILNVSSNLFLKLFGDSTNFTESRLSEEEIRSVISEGTKAGTIEPMEHNFIENVFNLSDMSVDKIMIPRAAISALDISDPGELIVKKAVESGYSRLPIYQGDLNNVIGILYTKKLLPELRKERPDIDLKQFLVPPYFVPNSMKASEVLKRMQSKKAHVALVTNEHGEVEGLVTLEDVLEEIVGEIADETDETDRRIKQDSMGFTVAGNTTIVDFNKYFRTSLPEDEDFNTVAGFILEQLGRFPKLGDTVVSGEMKFTVKEASLRTINILTVERV